MSFHGGRRFGNRGGKFDGLGLLRFNDRPNGLSHSGGLEVLEDFEGAEVKAVGTINAALNAGKGMAINHLAHMVD